MPFEGFKTKVHKKPVRTAKRLPLHPKDAAYRALNLLQNDRLSDMQRALLEVLMTAGALTTTQLQSLLPISRRSLRRYYLDYLIDHHTAPFSLRQFEMPKHFRELRLYSLGSIGRAWLDWQNLTYPTYEGYQVQQLTHDVLCNEIVLALRCAMAQSNQQVSWYGKAEAQVYSADSRDTNRLLEPDAMLIAKDKRQQAMVVEFHNETHRNRTAEKVERYERIARTEAWRASWPIDTFPLVLVVSHKKTVMDGYTDALTAYQPRGLACTYLGKPLQHILERRQIDSWVDLRTGRRIQLWKRQVKG